MGEGDELPKTTASTPDEQSQAEQRLHEVPIVAAASAVESEPESTTKTTEDAVSNSTKEAKSETYAHTNNNSAETAGELSKKDLLLELNKESTEVIDSAKVANGKPANGNGKVLFDTGDADSIGEFEEDEKLRQLTTDSQREKPTGFASFRGLYAFADSVDLQLMILGVVLSLLQAVIPPLVWVFMGNFVSYSIHRELVRNALEKNTTLDGLTNVTFDHFVEANRQFDEEAQPLSFWMLGLSLIIFISCFLQRLAWEVTGIRQVFRVKRAYVRKLLHMDVSWLESRQSGQVASMLHDHADSIYSGIADHIPMAFFIVANLLVTSVICVRLQWDVALLMFLAFPILIITRIIFSKWFCKTMDEEQRLQNKIANLVSETFSCIRTLISFGAQRQTISKYERLSAEHNRIVESRLTASSVYDSLAQVLLTELIFTAALCYGIWRRGTDNPGDLAALAVNLLYMCVTSISIGFHMSGAQTAKQNANEMNELLKEAPLIETDMRGSYRKKKASAGVKRKDKLKPLDVDSLQLEKEKAVCLRYKKSKEEEIKRDEKETKKKGAIVFKDIRFAYPSRPDIEVLKGVSFSVAAGEHLAIVGSSGSGKSTLTALLLRFYDPNQGSIFLDGVDLKRICPDELRAQCGYVSQEPVLFDGTISDNIRYGRLDATQLEINEAARKVGAWQFISALPEGMQTRVGDRGLQLSGGQKQRVAIARAVIRRPHVMMFDEATSALDSKHEEEVQTAIDAASEGRTSITIAHRLSTIKNADRIIVLEGGRIAEEGSPEELMANENGRFHKMSMEQRLDSLAMTQPRNSRPTLLPTYSFSPADKHSNLEKKEEEALNEHGEEQQALLDSERPRDAESVRRAWVRSSLGANRRLGKSYSVISTDRAKLALPVMSKKRSVRMNYKYSTNVVDIIDIDEKSFDDNELPGKKTNFHALWSLIRGYKAGYGHLGGAVPVTIIRGIFFLLVCFEVSQVLQVPQYPAEDRSTVIFNLAAIYTALIIIKTIFEALGRLFIAMYGHGFCEHMRGEMFRKILRHGNAYFDEEKNSPGRLTHRLINDTASLNKIVGEKLDLLIPAVICSCFSIACALFFNIKLALLCGFQFPAYFVFRLVELRETTKRQRRTVEEEKKAAHLATVVLSNMSTIKAYTLQEHFHSIFVEALKPLAKAMKRQSVISAFVFACQSSFTYILIAITLYFGRKMILNDEIDTTNYVRVVLLTQFGANFFSLLVASVSDFTKARVAAENILHVINENAVDMDNLSDEGLRPKLIGTLRLQNVTFRYPSRPIIPVLKNLTLRVEAGESIAIVGPSGSGKSSILSLLQRMYSPTEGQVIIDKYNVRSINPAYLRRVVVSVGQEPSLFSFTIKENIAYGLLEEEATMEKVIRAAKIANIHDFIVSLPQGYDTEVGEFGAQLSGGQKQRIAIARAIIRDPVVLLLDEATAALDSTSEKLVQAALDEASRSCTCITVAHRMSTIRNADKVVVLVEGGIAEMGTHDELLEKRGLYYEMNQSDL